MITILVIIGILCILEFILTTTFSGYWYYVVAAAVFIIVIESLTVFCLNRRRGKMSKREQRRYTKLKEKENDEYSRAISVYNAQMNEYNLQRQKMISEKKQNYADRIAEAEKRSIAAKERLAEAERVLDNDTTLGDDEKEIETVDYLIGRISSRRADSVKEALLQYDQKIESEERAAKTAADEKKRLAKEQLQREFMLDRQIEEDRRRRREEINDSFNRMEKELEQKRRLGELQDTLDEINRKL